MRIISNIKINMTRWTKIKRHCSLQCIYFLFASSRLISFYKWKKKSLHPVFKNLAKISELFDFNDILQHLFIKELNSELVILLENIYNVVGINIKFLYILAHSSNKKNTVRPMWVWVKEKTQHELLISNNKCINKTCKRRIKKKKQSWSYEQFNFNTILPVSLKYLHVSSLSKWKETCLFWLWKSKGKKEETLKYPASFDYHEGVVILQEIRF